LPLAKALADKSFPAILLISETAYTAIVIPDAYPGEIKSQAIDRRRHYFGLSSLAQITAGAK
jgi:hypothetical protein